jgi:hypothetical protein
MDPEREREQALRSRAGVSNSTCLQLIRNAGVVAGAGARLLELGRPLTAADDAQNDELAPRPW